MKRGEVWTLRDNGYASKARPVVVLQVEGLSFDSVVLCLLTSFDLENAHTRIRIEPSSNEGLLKTSFVMTEKIITVDKTLLGNCIGILDEETMKLISRSVAGVLGIKKDDLDA